MAHETSAFEVMPLELLVNVLSNISTLEDVLATIKASPAALSAFMTGPERIYAAVLETCLAPEIFRELLAIVNAPDHNDCPAVAPEQPDEELEEGPDPVVDEWDAWGYNAYDFFKRHARGAVYPIPDPKMNSTKFNAQIRFMVRLYFCLSKFVNFYPTFARNNAARPQPVFPPTNGMDHRVQEGQEWPPLTETERLRLQRGLLRYEMLCRLIGIPSVVASCNSDIYHAVISRRSCSSRIWMQNRFSGILPIDEVEEIVCASIYVRTLYHILHWSSVEEFQNHVLSLSQGRGDSALDKGGSDIRKTAEYWLSHTKDQIFDFDSLGTYQRRDVMRISTMCVWLNKEENQHFNQQWYERDIPDKVLETLFTEQEWEELVIKKYTPKDHRGDYQAMSQFVAGARAVVDFSSNQLPRLD
ncbi:hypothetical protein SLS64_013712 [Diaporthe eres]|uniref:F-box domain-containing protein n=1 Tax=Diaporthe eres TaxID=83184 RepID=A0ABR1PCC6_DIAER